MGRLRVRDWQLGFISVIICVSLLYAAVITRGTVQPVLADIGSSFAFVGMVRLLQLGREQLLNKRFRTFFGSELCRDQTVFVYPDFEMHDEVRAILGSHNQQLIYQRPRRRSSASREHRIDLELAVARNDIQALLYVSSLFDSTPSCPNIMQVDGDIVEQCDSSFISFGLSSNDCTHLYLDESDDPLFEIVEDGSGSEYLRMSSGREYVSTTDKQFGLILRHTPANQGVPGRRWFIIAGLGASGTTGAAWFLSHNWRELAKRTRPGSDFAVIVSCSPHTDRTAKLIDIHTSPQHKPPLDPPTERTTAIAM